MSLLLIKKVVSSSPSLPVACAVGDKRILTGRNDSNKVPSLLCPLDRCSSSPSDHRSCAVGDKKMMLELAGSTNGKLPYLVLLSIVTTAPVERKKSTSSTQGKQEMGSKQGLVVVGVTVPPHLRCPRQCLVLVRQWFPSHLGVGCGFFVRHSMASTLRLCQRPMEDPRVVKRLYLR